MFPFSPLSREASAVYHGPNPGSTRPSGAYLFEGFAHLYREPGGPAGFAVHVDVDEVPLGGGGLLVVPEQPDLVAHAAVAQPGDAQAGVHDIREGDRPEEPAPRLDDQADDPALLDVERPRGDEILVYDRVEVRVVDDVVDVAVDVVIHPAGRNRKEPPVPIARLGYLPIIHSRPHTSSPPARRSRYMLQDPLFCWRRNSCRRPACFTARRTCSLPRARSQ